MPFFLPMDTGCLYTGLASEPYLNMAFDEWLFSKALLTPSFVAARLYTWRPGGITIGFHQQADRAVDVERLGDTAVIRRITGGRAIFHDPSELTYAIAVNPLGLGTYSFSGSLTETTRNIARFLRHFLDRVGITARYVRHSEKQKISREFFHSAPCFASTARHELISDGCKIVASAQKRIGAVFLQHGSIKPAGPASHPALPGEPGPGTVPPPPVDQVTYDMWQSRFSESFESYFGVRLTPGCLTDRDRQQLIRRVTQIRKKPLLQRHFIEQTATPISL